MNSLGNATKVSYYQQKMEARREAIEAILFNEDVGIWNGICRIVHSGDTVDV
jgi:neutral trehalase